MPKYEVTMTVDAPNLSTAVGRLIWDQEGEAVEWIDKIWAEKVEV